MHRLFFRTRSLGAILFLTLMVSACGYRFSGSGTLPSGVKTISVAIFENRTAETGVAHIFTNDIIYELTRNGNTVRPVGKADANLTGVIEGMNIETVSRKGQITSLERQVRATVRLTLTDREGQVIWSAREVSDEEAYAVMDEKVATDYNKRVAIQALSERFAERVYSRLTDNF